MDIYQYFGSDIVTSVNGDLQTVDTVLESQQRILRRLLTNPGTYIWHVGYGAGLPQYVGIALSNQILQKINGLVLSQMQLEGSVAQNPAPKISLQTIPNGLYCSIIYTLSTTLTQTVLNFTVTK
jgi:hypothetical protein